VVVVFFKKKTAYEISTRDWSSDVCSSDLSVIHELEKEGLGREIFDNVFAPMGLEIGAESPEEIAVSVVAEMIAVRRQPKAEWKDLSKSIFAQERLKALLK